MHRWEVANEKGLGGVTCLDNFDITGDGVPELLVGRSDGAMEIYAFDETDEPRLKYSAVSSFAALF